MEFLGEVDGVEKVLDEIDSLLEENAPSNARIVAYVVRDATPRTSRGKVDYQRLIQEGIQPGDGRVVFMREDKGAFGSLR